MVNEELLGGLKSALERGQNLQTAMITFFNSGYKKEEIEEAARFLIGGNQETSMASPAEIYTPPVTRTQISPSIVSPKPAAQVPSIPYLQQPSQVQPLIQKPSIQIQQPVVQAQQPIQLTKPVQKVSSYESVNKEYFRDRPVIFVLVLLLIFLTGSLVFTLLFKQQIIDYISNFFG